MSVVSYAVGDAAAALDGIRYDRAELTLVVGVHSTCSYCGESMPSIASLQRLTTDSRGRTQFVVVSGESTKRTRAYLASFHLAPEWVVNVPSSSPYVRSTPSFYAVDNSGTVKALWIGAIRQHNETSVWKQLCLDP